MSELVHIGNADISIKEYRGQRVVTFKDIDAAHKRPDGTARKRFADNRKHFIEGEDFFVVTPQTLENTKMSEKRTSENTGMYEKRTSGIKEVNPRGTTFITEQGYLMLAKSFTDDLAWDVQRQLVNGYFRVSRIVDERLSPQLQVLEMLVNQMKQKELEDLQRDKVVQELKETTENIKNAVQPVFDNWREETNTKFKRIQHYCDIPFDVLRNDMYSALEHRAGCDLNARLRNMKKRLRDNGATKAKIETCRKIDVIEGDKKLREIFSKIVSEYEIKYCA